MRSGLPLLAALGLSLSCRSTPGEPPVRRELCPPPASDTVGWQAVAYGPFTTILPAAFRRDTTTFRCFHGGEFWADGRRAFGYCVGTFDRVAPTDSPNEQIMSVAGRPAVVACTLYRGRWSVTAYHVGDSTTFGIHGESPELAGLAPFVRALRSAQPRPR
jgi:hypothetical protein